MARLARYFKSDEFACQCGQCPAAHAPLMHLRLIEILDKVRGNLGTPLSINSGIRCAAWNKHVGSQYPTSWHIPRSMDVDGSRLDLGLAVDVTFTIRSQRQPINILRLYMLLESYSRPTPVGLGCYPTWVHFDVRGLFDAPGGRPAAARWSQGFPFPRL